MSVVGVVTTAMVGFVGLSFGSLADEFSNLIILIFLMISLFFMMTAIWNCLSIIKTEKSIYPITSKKLLKKISAEYQLNSKIYDEWTSGGKNEYYEDIAESYLISIKDKEDKIIPTARKFNKTVYIFIAGLVIQVVPWIIVFVDNLYK